MNFGAILSNAITFITGLCLILCGVDGTFFYVNIDKSLLQGVDLISVSFILVNRLFIFTLKYISHNLEFFYMFLCEFGI